MNRNPGLVLFGLVLAAGVTLAAWIIAAPLQEMKAAGALALVAAMREYLQGEAESEKAP